MTFWYKLFTFCRLYFIFRILRLFRHYFFLNLIIQKAEFAKAEGEMLGRAKAVFAQNIDGEANLKQSRKACDEISKLYSFGFLNLIEFILPS